MKENLCQEKNYYSGNADQGQNLIKCSSRDLKQKVNSVIESIRADGQNLVRKEAWLFFQFNYLIEGEKEEEILQIELEQAKEKRKEKYRGGIVGRYF